MRAPPNRSRGCPRHRGHHRQDARGCLSASRLAQNEDVPGEDLPRDSAIGWEERAPLRHSEAGGPRGATVVCSYGGDPINETKGARETRRDQGLQTEKAVVDITERLLVAISDRALDVPAESPGEMTASPTFGTAT